MLNKMDGFIGKYGKYFSNQKVLKAVPFFLVVIGAPFALQYLTKMRYKYRKVTEASKEDLAELEKQMVRKPQDVTLESEYEKLKEMDIDNWEQVRGPRPWDEEPGQGHGKR